MRKKTPDPIVYYIKRFLTVVALPYFMYTNYQLYNVYKVVQQRKLEDKEKELENSQNGKKKHFFKNIFTYAKLSTEVLKAKRNNWSSVDPPPVQEYFTHIETSLGRL